MIKKYFFQKVATSLFTKVAQGDARGLVSYLKKAALGIVIGIVVLLGLCIAAVVFLVQFIISLFTDTLNIDSLRATHETVVTEIVESVQKVKQENINTSIIQAKEMVSATLPLVTGGEAVISTLETYIQKLNNLLP